VATDASATKARSPACRISTEVRAKAHRCRWIGPLSSNRGWWRAQRHSPTVTRRVAKTMRSGSGGFIVVAGYWLPPEDSMDSYLHTGSDAWRAQASAEEHAKLHSYLESVFASPLLQQIAARTMDLLQIAPGE